MPANIDYGQLHQLLTSANRGRGRSYHSGTYSQQIKDTIAFIEQGMSPADAARYSSQGVKPRPQPVQEQPVEQATSTPFIDVNADPYAGGEKQPYVASSVDEIIQPAPTIIEQEPAYDPMNTGATAEEIQTYDYQDPERLARIEAMFPPVEEEPVAVTPTAPTVPPTQLVQQAQADESLPPFVRANPSIPWIGNPAASLPGSSYIEEEPGYEAYTETAPAYETLVEDTAPIMPTASNDIMGGETGVNYLPESMQVMEELPAYETLVQNQPFIDIAADPYAGGETQPMAYDPAGRISEVVDDTGIMSLSNEAIAKRQEANDAVAKATNAYEADVAEFKDIEAKEAEDKVTNAFGTGIGSFGAASAAKTSYGPVDNWGEPGFEAYIPESEIIDPIQDFTPAEASPFIDTNPFNDVWEAPVAEVLPTAGQGAGTSARERYAPINNPFEPVEVDYDSTRDQLIDPNAPDPGMGWWDDPDAPGPDPDFWDPERGVYEPPPIDIPVLPPPPPPPYIPPPPPPPMVTGPTATPMNRLIAMQTGMFGGQPQGQYRPYEEPSEYTAQSPLNQPAPFPVMHGNRGGSIQQPTRNLKKLFNNPLDKGLGQLPVTGQNDTLTQIFQAGFRPRR